TTFDAHADGVWSAPGLVTIIGEHTDDNQGLSMATITPHRAYIAARLREDTTIRVVVDDIEPFVASGSTWSGKLGAITAESAHGWPAYVAGVLWAMQERGFNGPGMDVAVASCVPAGAALGHAAAIEACTALAANDLWRLALDHDQGLAELAECCVDGENMIAGRPSGGREQHTALRCHDNEAILLDFEDHHPRATACPLQFPDYGLALLAVDTQVRTKVEGGVRGMRRVDCERAAQALGLTSLRQLQEDPRGWTLLNNLDDPILRKRARHVYSENDRVMLVRDKLSATDPAEERFVAVGQALSRSHASLDADFDVSSPELNLAVTAAADAGALGGKLIGGGFGGSVMVLVRRAHVERIAKTISETFLEAGLKRPQFLLV
ncbi:MAG: galactokinase family protein, partial [Demequina sp.]